jgi:GTPase SAR1 family protein
VLVGNKCDIESYQRQVPTEQAEKLAAEWGVPFFETSAKTKHNNAECFYEVVREIRKLKEAQKKNAEEKKPKKFWCSIL